MISANRYSYLPSALLLPAAAGLLCKGVEKVRAKDPVKKGLHAAFIGIAALALLRNGRATKELADVWGDNVKVCAKHVMSCRVVSCHIVCPSPPPPEP